MQGSGFALAHDPHKGGELNADSERAARRACVAVDSKKLLDLFLLTDKAL
jgi:hypothetical protein